MRRCLSAVFLAAAVGLTGCASGGDESAESVTSSTSARPDAPELDQMGSYYNFISQSDDGLTMVLAGVRTAYTDDWVGLVDDPVAPTVLDPGEYRVVATSTQTCPGAGEEISTTTPSDSDEVNDDGSMGVVGTITVKDKGAAAVQSNPVKRDPDSLAGLVLADDEGTVVACSKRVNWTPPVDTEADSE
ncbi:hypothetical protein KRX51_08575 [Corynebacterium sp. TAE3-ERU12]|uniref:hypothetical protein n=1 Tax=Corynebacterium sp. TAE3-ERU12 TaxID=2849491 RepID=UPI001C486482|nr:hypothetical protein [Corynebacterium sp. TAE3-ERU12]MBV7295962.1 hypothetical protein [Corynebacterium sp. TAE3-ERU12]